MKLDYSFAESTLKADGTPDYAPAVLRVVTHHHEEGVDPETGEPWSRDWDTYETKLHPTAATCRWRRWRISEKGTTGNVRMETRL